jgi:Cys-tRNA(Pro)/Cys-tRNA(Cys) deacylase
VRLLPRAGPLRVSGRAVSDNSLRPVRLPREPGQTAAMQSDDTPALAALRDTGLEHSVLRHGPVRSLAEAAEARGVEPEDVVKTLVVRRGEDDYLFVLVPEDRSISWPKLRTLLAVSRMSMPDAATAKEATGYERGTITPFGATRAWPVIADERVRGRRITLGGGAHGVAVAVDADRTLQILDATVADVSDPEG